MKKTLTAIILTINYIVVVIVKALIFFIFGIFGIIAYLIPFSWAFSFWNKIKA